MPTLAEFLMNSVKKRARHIFGVPGDYVLNLYHQLDKSFKVINTTDEQGAGFAADGYARVNGFGVVCVTYCVGGFKIINPIAGAYAEKSPVLVISGAPGVKERQDQILLHHAAGPYECQHNIFKNITCASAVLDNPDTACFEIERVMENMDYYKQPGYIEVPRDMVNKNVKYDAFSQNGTYYRKPHNEENLNEAIQKSIEWIKKSKNPVIWAGVELARFGFGEALMKFAERHNIPVATSLLSKSVVNEKHPLSVGVYCGGMSHQRVKDIVEKSDCVLMLGVLMTDMNLAFQPLQCDQTNVILANTGRVRVRRSTYENVEFSNFVSELLESKLECKFINSIDKVSVRHFVPQKDKLITSSRLFEKIDSILDSNMSIISDIGDSLFGAADLTVHHDHHFIASSFYASMGSSVPMALGVQCALPHVRALVIVGDGAFQMTGMEFSTIVKNKMNSIVFVLNNGGYETERHLGYDGQFNNVQPWEFHKIPEIVNGGQGYLVKTEEELENAVTNALLDKNCPAIINVVVEKLNPTPALKRMTKSLSSRV